MEIDSVLSRVVCPPIAYAPQYVIFPHAFASTPIHIGMRSAKRFFVAVLPFPPSIAHRFLKVLPRLQRRQTEWAFFGRFSNVFSLTVFSKFCHSFNNIFWILVTVFNSVTFTNDKNRFSWAVVIAWAKREPAADVHNDKGIATIERSRR